MQNVNLHKQRLIAIAIGVLGLIFLFLPWIKMGSTSHMGYGIWGGIICALAFAVVIVDSILLGDKIKPFDKQGKLIAIISFALALLLTIIVLISSSGTNQVSNGYFVVEVKESAGIGVWLSLILEIAGLVWVSGIADKFMQSSMSPGPSGPPPPPPPKL
jgi:hypothetical protein